MSERLGFLHSVKDSAGETPVPNKDDLSSEEPETKAAAGDTDEIFMDLVLKQRIARRIVRWELM